MLDTESRWSEALTNNNIKSIICWLEDLTDEGANILPVFSCWVQRTSEFAKKELITLCFSHCHGLWMFLDRNSFTRVHVLLQRLRNLLTLAQWARQQHYSAHLWHGVGIPCSSCGDRCSTDVRHSCWSQAHRVLKQHIWLGHLVQWWGIMGLLPKFPEAQEVKRIAQMWRDMEHSHRKTCLDNPRKEEENKRRFSSLIQGMVMHLDRQHIWTSEDRADQCYPPPNLQALLKLVLVPCIDNTSVQAIFMYFIQDVANFLQCKDDLLQSFCHAFTIPTSFSQQIKAFWMFDHGHIKASMEILLSPRACAPCLSWQHHCIIHCLLTRKQPQVALRYLRWIRPAVQTPEDAKLCADVLLQCSCVSDAWALLKKGHTDSEDTFMYFLRACERFSLCAEALKYIPASYREDENYSSVEAKDSLLCRKDFCEHPPCPLSAKLYQAQKARAISSDDLIRLLRKATMEVRKPRPRMSDVVWPEHTAEQADSREISQSAQALHHLSLSPTAVDLAEETELLTHAVDPEWEAPVIHDMHLETQDHVSPSEDLRSASVSSFTSASSPSLLKRHHTYIYERTLTLQRISSLLTDGENPSSDDEEDEEEDEEESETLSSTDDSQSCSVLPQAAGGARGSDSGGDILNDSLLELMTSAEEEDVFPGAEDFSPDEQLNLRRDGHSLDDIDTDGKSRPDRHLKEGSSCEGVCSASFDQEHQSHRIATHTITSHCVLERKVQQKGRQLPRQDNVAVSHDSSSDASETTQEVLADLQQSLKEPTHELSLRDDDHKSSPVVSTRSISPTQNRRNSPALTPDSPCNIEANTIPRASTNESSADSKTDVAFVSNTSTWSDSCSVDSWGKQGSDIQFVAESGEASSGICGPSFVLSQSYTYSMDNFIDFKANPKSDRAAAQAEKEEAACWSGSGKVSQGAIRSGRTGARKGKRFKRT